MSYNSEKSMARYYATAGTSCPGSTNTVINFDTKDWDQNSAAVTTGSGWKFTAPRGGKYQVSASVSMAGATWSTNGVCELSIFKNGSQSSCLRRWVMVTGSTALTVITVVGSDVISLAASDYIDLRIFQNSNTGTVATDGQSVYNYVNITRLD